MPKCSSSDRLDRRDTHTEMLALFADVGVEELSEPDVIVVPGSPLAAARTRALALDDLIMQLVRSTAARVG
jgi:hypothetical protein